MESQDGALYEPIYIPLEGDNKQFIGAINEAERRIKGFSDATVAESKKIEKAFDNLDDAMKGPLKGIEDLSDEQSKLADQNVKTEGSISDLASTTGKYAGAIAVATAVLKTFKDGIMAVGSQSDAISAKLSGLKNSWQAFLKMVGTGDFSDFGSRISGAYKSGMEGKESLNRISDLNRQFALQSDRLNQEIEENRRVAYSEEKASYEQRISAADEMLHKMEEKKNAEVRLARETFEAQSKIILSGNRLTKEQAVMAMENYEAIVQIGRKAYLEKQALTVDEFKLLQETKKNLGLSEQEIKYILLNYENLTDGEKDLFLETYRSIQEAENSFLTSSRKAFDMREDLEGERERSIREIENRIILAKLTTFEKSLYGLNNNIQKELTALKQKYDEDLLMFGTNEAEKSRLTEAYNLDRLNIFKKQTQGIIDYIEDAYSGLGYNLLSNAIGRTGSGILPGNVKPTVITSTTRSLPAGDMEKLRPNKIEAKKNKDLEKEVDLRKEILENSILFTEQLASQLDLSQEVSQNLNDVLSIVSNLASGNYLGAALKILGNIVGTLLTMRDLPLEDSWKKQIEAWDELLKRQERLIALSKYSGNTEAAYKAKLETLDKEIKLTEAHIKEQESRRGSQSSLSGTDPLKDEKEHLAEMRYEYEQTKQQLREFGGITNDAIAEGILAGLEAGKIGVEDFGEYMQDTLRQYVVNAFMSKFLLPLIEKEVQPVVDKIIEDGVMTDPEKEEYYQTLSLASQKLQPIYDSMVKPFMGSDSEPDKSLSGAVKGVSEETASVLAGQINAIRISQAEGNDIVKQQLMTLHQIAANTRYCIFLESIDRRLSSMQGESLRASGLNQ